MSTTAMPLGFHSLPLPLAQLSLATVLKCGQSFRWSVHPVDASLSTQEYRLCLRDRVICLRQLPDALLYRAIFPDTVSPDPNEEATRDTQTLAWLRDYFQLDVDLVDLYKQWATKDTAFAKLQTRFEGIRMLRQDPWENLVSFICSSNNNISRITKMVNSLCTHYSPPLLSIPTSAFLAPTPMSSPSSTTLPQSEAYHPFPPPSLLVEPSVPATLRSLGFGYRADFIHKTAKMLVEAHGTTSTSTGEETAERWLHTLRDMPTDDARKELLKFMGVGRKVADCVLLMSLNKSEVIPVDTHVHQIAVKHYGMRASAGKQAMTPKLYDEISAKFYAIWGSYAGWAHSVLFTADLKSFSTYGLPTPSPTPAKRASPASTTDDATDELPIPVPPKKRPRKAAASKAVAVEVVATIADSTLEDMPGSSSLAERVKRRRVQGRAK